MSISIHALREEGDNGFCKALYWSKEFLSTPSARRATWPDGLRWHLSAISIHALREEGDGTFHFHVTLSGQFLSTPSARRATCNRDIQDWFNVFLSTPSARRATYFRHIWFYQTPISIHALREEGDCQPGGG